jgi:hypothetical protein
MKSRTIIGLVWLLCLLLGCSAPVASPTIVPPTMTPIVFAATATFTPPTIAPTPTVTPVPPSPTPSPTPSPLTATPGSKETLATSAADLIGSWQANKQGSIYYFTFQGDGVFVYRNGPSLSEAAVQARGTYQFDGTGLHITSPNCPTPGAYAAVLRKVSETQIFLTFRRIDDTCEAGRVEGFSGQWKWLTP